MRNSMRLMVAAMALVAGALAWQGGVALVGLTDSDAQNVAKTFFGSSGSDGGAVEGERSGRTRAGRS